MALPMMHPVFPRQEIMFTFQSLMLPLHGIQARILLTFLFP